jgi:hypothetical protein
MDDLERLHEQLQSAMMGSQMRQHADVARRQAQQQAEIIRLLQEQKLRDEAALEERKQQEERSRRERRAEEGRLERERKEQQIAHAREQARLATLLKCPDCFSPLERGVRRCTKCTCEVIQWIYDSPTYSWSVACRPADTSRLLHERCWSLLKEVALARKRAREALQQLHDAWLPSAAKQVQGLLTCLSTVDAPSRDELVTLLPQAVRRATLATPTERERLHTLRGQLNSKYDPLVMDEGDAKKRAVHEARIERMEAAISDEWYKKLDALGVLTVGHVLDRHARVFSKRKLELNSLRAALVALKDHLAFGCSQGLDWDVLLGCGPDMVQQWSSTIPGDVSPSLVSSESYQHITSNFEALRAWIKGAMAALDSMKVIAKPPSAKSR